MHSHPLFKLSVSPQCPLQEKLAQQHTSVQKHEGTNGDAVPHSRMMLDVGFTSLPASQPDLDLYPEAADSSEDPQLTRWL